MRKDLIPPPSVTFNLEASSGELVPIQEEGFEDCVDGQLNYKHEGIHADLVELYYPQGEEVNVTHSIKIEQRTYLEIDQLVNRKRAFGEVD